MRHAAFLLGLFLLGSPSTFAQAEYFLNGETEIGGEVSFISGNGQSGFGTGFEALFFPNVGMRVTYARSTIEGAEDVEGEPLEVSGSSIGVQVYPSRQGVGGPITIGLGLGVGKSEGINTFDATMMLARSIAATDDGPSFQFVPKVEAALSTAFADSRTASALVLAAGVGVALEVGSGAFAFVEPTAALAVGEEGGPILGGTFGIGVSLLR